MRVASGDSDNHRRTAVSRRQQAQPVDVENALPWQLYDGDAYAGDEDAEDEEDADTLDDNQCADHDTQKNVQVDILRLSKQRIAAFWKLCQSPSTQHAAEIILSPELTKCQRAKLHGFVRSCCDGLSGLDSGSIGEGGYRRMRVFRRTAHVAVDARYNREYVNALVMNDDGLRGEGPHLVREPRVVDGGTTERHYIESEVS